MRYSPALLLLGGFLLSAQSNAGQSAQRISMPDSVLPVLARAKPIGAVPSSEPIHLTVSLNPRYPRELEAFCNEVSNPRSPRYRQFMTPSQVGEAFGASTADIEAVKSFLRSSGLRIELVAPNRMAILAVGSPAQIQGAFGTVLRRYAASDPRTRSTLTFRANSGPITIPSKLSGVVLDVHGLQTYRRPKCRQTLTPSQVRTLYKSANAYGAGFHGEGITVGITNHDGFSLDNVPLYLNANDLPSPSGGAASNIQIVSVGTPAYTGFSFGEGDLDIQMVLSTAPLANVVVYDTSDNFIGLLVKEASDNLADVITESWGYEFTNSEATAAHNQHLSMTAQGITYMSASGDEGTFLGTFDYPNFDPEVLLIGGTAATTNTNGDRISENGWNGTGSGWSERNIAFNKLPTWQTGNGVPTNRNFRLFPDIALHAAAGMDIASGAGYIAYHNGMQEAFRGTSCTAPMTAGLFATLQQRLVALGQSARLGRIQDLIYSQNGRSDVWFDVTTGNTGFLPDGTFGVGHAGWDFVTGWGAPNMDGLYASLAGRLLQGAVTLSNWSGATAGTSVTIQVYAAGTGTLVDTRAAILGSSGTFAVTTSAPAGTYDIYVKGSHWLRKKRAGVVVSSTGATGIDVTLANGDVNADNVVSISDFNRLRSAFGSQPGAGNWNAQADLNGDQVVSLGDFQILRTNFGQSGD